MRDLKVGGAIKQSYAGGRKTMAVDLVQNNDSSDDHNTRRPAVVSRVQIQEDHQKVWFAEGKSMCIENNKQGIRTRRNETISTHAAHRLQAFPRAYLRA
jgi:hypothetical protein